MRKFVVVVAVGLLLLTGVSSQTAFDFSYKGLDGDMHSFQDRYSGRYVLVDAFATWCGPCKEAVPHLKEMLKYRGEVVDVFSLSVSPDTDSLAKVKQYVKETGITWETGIDSLGDFIISYPPETLPGYFLFDDNGTMIYNFGIEEADTAEDYIRIVDTYIDHNLTSFPSAEKPGFVNKLGILLATSALIGVLTSLSPCLFPMMPTYFAIVAKDNKASRGKMALSVFVLGAGILIVFSILGLIYNATIGLFLISNYSTLLLVQGAVLLLAGLLMIKTPAFILNITLPSKLNDLLYSEKAQNNILLLSFLVGLFYTIIAAPCAFSYFIWQWSLVLTEPYSTKFLAFTIFSLGAILPFFLIAVFFPELKARFSSKIQEGSNKIKYIVGVILLIIGVYIMLDSQGVPVRFWV